MKAYFKACDLKERQQFHHANCIMPTSVGQGLAVHEGDKLRATINLVSKSFKCCTLLIDDTLQRHTLKIFDQTSSDDKLIASTLNEGDVWLKRNKPIYETLKIDYKILRWSDWLKHPQYPVQREHIAEIYATNNEYREAVDLAINQYIKRALLKQSAIFDYRHAYACCLEYLLEECSVMCLWALERYDVELYPSGRNPAMTIAHKYCVKDNKNMGKLVSVSLYFRDKKLKHQHMPSVNDVKRDDINILNTLNMLPVNIYLKDRIGQFIWCNSNQLNALGVNTLEEIIGKTDFHFRDIEVANKIMQNDCEVMNSRELITSEEMVIEDGLEVFYLSKKSPLLDNNGNIIGVLGISIDLSEQRNQYTQLLKFKEQDVKTLENILSMVPVHIYWKDCNGIYLGCNDLQAKNLGLKSRREIVGKTDFELSESIDAANIFRNNDAEIINSGTPIVVEETVVIDQLKTPVLSYKTPLYNDNKNPVGIVGVSVNITAQKEAEKLMLEKQAHQAAVTEQEKFRKEVRQLGHDITTPLSSLNNIINRLANIIPENERVTLRNAAESITGIAQRLMNKYNPDTDKDGNEIFLVSLALMQIVNERREDHRETGVLIELAIREEANFICIRHNIGMFKRMIANLVKNAVEALKDVPNGKVKVELSFFADKAIIRVEDNGQGMPQHIQDKFKEGVGVTEGKVGGHGVGLTQVRDAIQTGNGIYKIRADETGTTFIIRFPLVPNPDWIATEIKLTRDDTVIILDDDESIHGSWDSSFKEILEQNPTLKIKHYTQGQDVIDYINSLTLEQKQNTFLLTDFELLEQNVNGLDVVKQTNMRRTILVTSYAGHADKQKEVIQLGIKMLPKELAAAVKIKVDKKLQKWSKKVDMVWVEDQKWYVDGIVKKYYSHLKVDTYYDPVSFMEEVHQYPLDTRIILDTYYDTPDGTSQYKQSGYDLAKELHALGYTKLILYTGEDPKGDVPEYLQIVRKKDPGADATMDKI